MLHVLGAVLIQGVADEIELPARLLHIADFPGVHAGSLQNVDDRLQHYPSLAFVFR